MPSPQANTLYKHVSLLGSISCLCAGPWDRWALGQSPLRTFYQITTVLGVLQMWALSVFKVRCLGLFFHVYLIKVRMWGLNPSLLMKKIWVFSSLLVVGHLNQEGVYGMFVFQPLLLLRCGFLFVAWCVVVTQWAFMFFWVGVVSYVVVDLVCAGRFRIFLSYHHESELPGDYFEK